MTPIAFTLLAGLFGLMVGSFLNVCIYRLPLAESIVWPGSRCTSCGRSLSWFDNIPVLSYVAVGGRCRTCRAPISIVYPLVEVSTSLAFAWFAWQTGPGLLFFQRIVLAAILITLFVIDLQHRILPNVITLPGIVVGFAFSLFLPPGWLSSAIGIVVGGGTLLAIAEGYYRWRGEEGLGMGDVKMLAMIGAFLGWQLTLVTLVLSSFAGAFVGVAIIAASRGNLKYALPFGTFLSMGAFLAAAVGERLLAWYLRFY